MAEQEGLSGSTLGAPSFGATDQEFDVPLRLGGKQSVDIGKPFQPMPPMQCAVHAEIREEIFLSEGAQSCSPSHGYYPRRYHDGSIRKCMRVQEQSPVQFETHPGHLIDEADVLAEWKQVSQLLIIDVAAGDRNGDSRRMQ